MRGLLADVNVQGHLPYLLHLLEAMDLSGVFETLELRFITFRDVGLHRRMGDRTLWNYCQREQWVLFTEDRNDDGPDSLNRTLDDSWADGHLPVLALSNKGRFESNRIYADRVAEDVATVLFGIYSDGSFRDQPRIYVPLRWP
jgi:hypothetical protein